MKKKSKSFLLILSLFLCLLTSCGIPNYFGNVGNYAHFSGDSFYIDAKTLPDGFSTSQIQPKIMFLYTIYTDNKVNDTSISSMEYKLQNQFRDDYKLADYDYKGCPDVGDKPVSEVTIKDSTDTEVSYTLGLYQLKTLDEVASPSSYNTLPTNYSNEYLFNRGNMAYEPGRRYHFTYSLERVGESNDVTLIISCLDERNNVVSAYRMGNYRLDSFHTAYVDKTSPDYQYGKEDNANLCILPVLYLESNVYNNRQMVIGTWKSIKLEAPKIFRPENNDKNDNSNADSSI